MLGSKLRNVRNGLGVLAGQVTDDQWGLIMMAREELTDAADVADELENAMAGMWPGPADAAELQTDVAKLRAARTAEENGNHA